jgi:hypothetical protein
LHFGIFIIQTSIVNLFSFSFIGPSPSSNVAWTQVASASGVCCCCTGCGVNVGATDARLQTSSLSDNRLLKSFLARVECAGQLGKHSLGARSLRACTTLRRPVVCRASNLTCRQMYRQVVHPIDREVVCKLFNALHLTLD